MEDPRLAGIRPDRRLDSLGSAADEHFDSEGAISIILRLRSSAS